VKDVDQGHVNHVDAVAVGVVADTGDVLHIVDPGLGALLMVINAERCLAQGPENIYHPGHGHIVHHDPDPQIKVYLGASLAADLAVEVDLSNN